MIIFQRFIQIFGGAFILFMVLGGGFAHREPVGDNTIRTSILTMYPKLPPAPQGPAYCSIFDYGDRGVVLPCNYKPPFIGWLQGGKY